MKNNLRKIFLLITLILPIFLIYPQNIYALDDYNKEVNTLSMTPSQYLKYNYLDYVIDKYDININVNENNTFDITEKITAHFNIPKHGIYRTIPLRNTITRLDGTTSTNIAKITNLSIDDDYSATRENNNYKIKIGSADKTIIGNQTYTIKYTYNIGKDHLKDYDELYYNIIGNEWDTVIGNITFTINMPKEFDNSKLGFSSGIKGDTNNSNIKYSVNGNTISGNYNGILDIAEALTVRCELDEGYFVGAGFKINSIVYLMFIIPILFLIISLLLWYKYGRNNKVIETIEFYPPEGLNSLEVGFLYKGYAENKDVTSLLIYLANKGYLKISEIEEKSLFLKSKGFKITKLKNYEGNNPNERIFLNGLFQNTSSDKFDEVTSSELSNSFYLTMNKILYNMSKKENKNKIYEKSNSIKSIIVAILIIFSLLITLIIPTIEYGTIVDVRTVLIICIIYLPFFVVGIVNKIPLMFRIFWLGFTTLHCSLAFSNLPLAYAITSETIYLFGFLTGIVCLIGMIICLKLMPKRNKYGTEILGKIKGFKTFLETAEKDKLESMVLENPTYFYDILPYTYVLGVSDKWIKKFETISLPAPNWYDSPNNFNIVVFNSFINDTMNTATRNMSSSPSGSGGSGGGSSGGGSGGGGGGSW